MPDVLTVEISRKRINSGVVYSAVWVDGAKFGYPFICAICCNFRWEACNMGNNLDEGFVWNSTVVWVKNELWEYGCCDLSLIIPIAQNVVDRMCAPTFADGLQSPLCKFKINRPVFPKKTLNAKWFQECLSVVGGYFILHPLCWHTWVALNGNVGKSR